MNPNDPITTNSETNDMRAAARSVGQRIEILQASTAHDIETAFASLIGMQVGALLVAPDPVFVTEANQLVALARAIQYPRCIGEARLPKPAA